MSSATAAKGTPTDVALSALIPAPYNARCSFEAIEELAGSIVIDGVLEPLLVRVHPKQDEKFEIIAGHRRARAAELAGLEHVPVMLMDVGDAAARRICATENLQREGLLPLEEARAIQSLVDDYGVTEAAQQMGKSVRYIARRSNLLGLTKKWTKALGGKGRLAGSPGPALELIALLGPSDQDELLSWYKNRGVPDLDSLKREVGERLRTLKMAAWNLEDETLVPKQGACSGCTRHSGAAVGLFEDQAVGSLSAATCRDHSCWKEKSTAVAKQKLAAAMAAHGDRLLLIAGGWAGQNSLEEDSVSLGQPQLETWQYSKAKKSEKGACPAFVVRGKDFGSVRWITPASTKSRGASGAKTAKAAPGSAADLKAKRERLQKRRDGFTVDWIRDRIEGTTGTPFQQESLEMVRLVFAYGVPNGHQGYSFTERKKAAEKFGPSDLWESLRGKLVTAIQRTHATDLGENLREAKWLVAQLWPTTSADLLKEVAKTVAEAIPKPRTLEALEAKRKPAKARKKPTPKRKKKAPAKPEGGQA